jgi:hypothetical protein
MGRRAISGLSSTLTRARVGSIRRSGLRVTCPSTDTRPSTIHERASVREQRPAFESTRSSDFSAGALRRGWIIEDAAGPDYTGGGVRSANPR